MVADPAQFPADVDALKRMVVAMAQNALPARTLIEKLRFELARLYERGALSRRRAEPMSGASSSTFMPLPAQTRRAKPWSGSGLIGSRLLIAYEIGAIKGPHGKLKQAAADALPLRGSADFLTSPATGASPTRSWVATTPATAPALALSAAQLPLRSGAAATERKS